MGFWECWGVGFWECWGVGFWECWGVRAGPQGRPAEPGDGGRRPPETAAGGLPCGPDCGFAGGCGGAGGLQGVGGKAGARSGQEGAGGRSGPQAKPSGGRFRRAKPAGPGGAGAGLRPCLPPLRKMGRGATGTGKRYRRRGSGGGVPGGRPPCRGSRRRCAGR